ncbi:MAG: type II toxin-antitoxin system VapC family toxin [Candidatus Limnocylindria bacterium]
MIILDTTVLAYAAGAEHPLRDPCRRILEAASRGSIVAVTTTHVIEEFVYVRARRRSREDAAELGRRYATLLAPLIATDADDLEEGLRLYVAHQSLGSCDSMLAAVALRRDARALMSADRTFAKVPGLRHVDPMDADGIDALIGGRLP